jgi:hypothetical protein
LGGPPAELKVKEKLRYMHRNPVKRGLVEKPEDWEWSSFRHYLTGFEGRVEIESSWTARRREKLGITLKAGLQKPTTRPSKARDGAPSGVWIK